MLRHLNFIFLTGIVATSACATKVIEVESAEIVGDSSLQSAMPNNFIKNEGLQSKIIGVKIRLSGHALHAFARRNSNPIVLFTNCNKTTLEHSFGPFMHGAYVIEYTRDEDVVNDSEYSIFATITPRTAAARPLCVQLESRFPSGVVAISREIPVRTAIRGN